MPFARQRSDRSPPDFPVPSIPRGNGNLDRCPGGAALTSNRPGHLFDQTSNDPATEPGSRNVGCFRKPLAVVGKDQMIFGPLGFQTDHNRTRPSLVKRMFDCVHHQFGHDQGYQHRLLAPQPDRRRTDDDEDVVIAHRGQNVLAKGLQEWRRFDIPHLGIIKAPIDPAHDLKTPLSRIQYIERLARAAGDPRGVNHRYQATRPPTLAAKMPVSRPPTSEQSTIAGKSVIYGILM